MGKEVYDTSGKKAAEEADKYYFIKEPFSAVKFPKMKTYGLAGLITNDPAPHGIKFEKLLEKDPEFAFKIAKFLSDNGKKLKFFSLVNGELHKNEPDPKTKKLKENRGGESEIFINSPYTKTTEIVIDENFLKSGTQECYLTGEKYQKLVDTQCTSPFFAGIQNFNSQLSGVDKKISWKAMYLSRFSPKLSFHAYTGGLDTIYVYMFNTDNLLNLKKIRNSNRNLFKDKVALVEDEYRSNIRIYSFLEGKDTSKDFTEQNEFLFMLTYSFYKRILEEKNTDIQKVLEDWDIINESEYKQIPVSLISFKADKFAKTMRPDSFEEINNFKWLIRFIAYLEKHKISVYNVLQSLKFLKPSERSGQNHYRLERQLRNKVLGKIIKGKSILDEIESLFYDCFRFKTSKPNENIGFKSYKDLFELVRLYEKITKFGGNRNMTEILQQRAINLGKSIGQGILNFENSQDRHGNAKSGRTHIISLKKARTQQQFLDEIIRIQTKYGISVANDILESINPQNFVMIKQFCIISALNQMNSVFNKKPGE